MQVRFPGRWNDLNRDFLPWMPNRLSELTCQPYSHHGGHLSKPYEIKLLMQVHFAEEWNELHHLQIMESLGGDQMWWDRFLAQHSAIFYFWVLILFYTFAPRMAYAFSELVEVSLNTQ